MKKVNRTESLIVTLEFKYGTNVASSKDNKFLRQPKMMLSNTERNKSESNPVV